jgi:hypothetical protein
MTLASVFGADLDAIQHKATALVHSADQALAANHTREAEHDEIGESISRIGNNRLVSVQLPYRL